MNPAEEIEYIRRRLGEAEARLLDSAKVETELREAVEKHLTIISSIDEGFCVVEVIGGEGGEPVDYRFLEVNASFEQQTGLHNAVGRRMRELEPRHEEHWFERYSRIVQTRMPERFEDRADALGRWYDVFAFPIGDPQLRRVGILFRDVIERKRAEQELSRSNHLLQTTVDNCLQFIQLFRAFRNREGEWLLTNKQWNDRWGSNVGKRLLTENPAVVESGVWDKFLQVMESGSPITHEHYYKHEQFDGWFLQTIAKADDGILLSTLDITDRRRAEMERARTEAALRASEEKYRTIFNSIDDGLCIIEVIVDKSGKPVDLLHLEVNHAYERQTGLRNIVGKRALDVTPDAATWLTFYGNVARTGQAGRTEYYVELINRWFACHASRIGGDGSQTVAVVFNDITARKRAAIALRESEQRLAAAFEGVPAGLAVIGLDGRDVLSNKAYRRFLPSGVVPSRDSARTHLWQAWDELGQVIAPEDWPTARALRGERVVPGLEMQRTDSDGEETWANIAAVPTFDVAGKVTGVLSVIADITESKHAETILRRSEMNQAFLLKFSDTLRAEQSQDAVKNRALQLLFDYLQLDRCYIGVFNLAENKGDFTHQVGNDTVSPMPPSLNLSLFPEALRVSFDATLVIDNIETSPLLAADDKTSFAQLGFRALVAATLRKGEGVPLWSIVTVSSRPRKWSLEDVALIEEATERTWTAVERARAETALRESEERFRQFGRASSDGLWIRDAATLQLEYASDAMETIYGVSREDMTADPKIWPALIVPEDREETLGYIERVKAGESVVHEFRIQRRSDRQFRWIRSVGFPLVDNGNGATRIAGISSDVTEEKLLTEHQGVLLAELQHRVRNIMAMIRSMANRGGDGSSDIGEYRQLLSGRLLALARVQTILTRQANTGGALRDVIESEIGAQANHAGQYELTGPNVSLSPKAMEVLTLAFHELSTNALKYGALSVPGGQVRVTWSVTEKKGTPWLALDWVENGAPQREPPKRRGFGTDLIEGKIPYELGGIGKMAFSPNGASCHFELPLREGESVLETDAPASTLVFGGSLDMTGAPDLSGQSNLVVEDDYYLATDTAAALRGAGARVLGPCPSEEAAAHVLASETPTAAVVDLNLGGGGPKFEIARLLKKRGVPFVFLTGYDPDVIPEEYADILRLQKPLPLREMVEAVSKLSQVEAGS